MYAGGAESPAHFADLCTFSAPGAVVKIQRAVQPAAAQFYSGLLGGLNRDADWKLSVVSGPRNHI